MSPEILTCLTYLAGGALIIGLMVVLARITTEHRQHGRESRELEAKKDVRDRNSDVSDRAAETLIDIGRERQAAAEAVANWKIVLVGAAFSLALLAWSLTYYV